MNKRGFLSVLIFLFTFSSIFTHIYFASEKRDSLFIKFSGDTIQVWNINIPANCASRFSIQRIPSKQNTITIIETDTIGPHARCLCNFDLNISLTGLTAGNYTIRVFRQQLKQYNYPSDTTLLIGNLDLLVNDTISGKQSLVFQQSSCHAYHEQKFTAKELYSNVKASCHAIQPEAGLINIFSDFVSPNGKAGIWNYEFLGYDTLTGRSKRLYFHNSTNSIINDSASILIKEGAAIINDDWLNSDTALTYAFSAGGRDFILDNPDYVITASLSQALDPPSYPTWNITYISQSDTNKKFNISFDARKVIDGVKKDIYSKEYFLGQNYPYPFNPVTVISYSIPVGTRSRQGGMFVQLKIFDVMGRDVSTLVNKEQIAGTYEVEFDGSKLSSGIYFYVLKAGGNILSRKMCLLK